ncbi:MAG: class II aldolase/adducin family protein [Betaproteobacteria bacterium]|nr:class II aldolase/adducin family protein [Betaproteobacteria bacterium]
MTEQARQLRSVIADSSSARSRMSPGEWEVRCDLAAAYQLAHLFRWTDLIFTHFTARVPGTRHMLINPYGLMFDEITASTLVKIDEEGDVIEDSTGLGVNHAGFVIHGCVHAARPEVNCVIHTHTRAGVAVSAQKDGLLALSQHALRTFGMLTYHDYEGIALELDERTRLARDLGPESKAMILRNHGLLSLGATVGEAFELMYYLDTACQIQIDALAGGRNTVIEISEPVAQKGYQQFQGPGGAEVSKAWTALVRMLERKGVDYRC